MSIVESDGPPSWSLDASETGESTPTHRHFVGVGDIRSFDHLSTCTAETPFNASINSSGAHPPRDPAGHLLTLSVPGVGHLQFYRSPGGWALAYPGATPGHLTRDFERHISLSGRTKPLSKTGLSIRD